MAQWLAHTLHALAGLGPYLWLIPALPLFGAAVNGLFGRRLSTAWVSALAVSTVTVSAILSVAAFTVVQKLNAGGPLLCSLGDWFSLDRYRVGVSFSVDALGAVMIVVVTVVSTLIHIYSIGYMKGDPGYSRYFAYLNLFVFAMLVLVMADNLVLMFVGWEGVGLCSYLLIGFWYSDEEKATAGKKAFIVNRIGDLGFIIGIILLFHYCGTADFAALREIVPSFDVRTGTLTAITLLLFVGACGKSAQFPLYVWLPDAMAGPTPVSALIHAATMVTAGVYMVSRLSFMFTLAPVTMAVVALVGAFTALFAATIGLAQNDIKKVLAYSTVSQLGYMFAGAGVAAFAAGMTHLVTHAFFKACLFLCAGSVIHALSGEQDVRKMGGLREKLPHTRFTFAIATWAISGILLSGFWSKDEIIWASLNAHNDVLPGLNWIVWGTLTFTAFLTSLYMWRLYYLVFSGEYRGGAHPHESPPVMTWPLYVLAGVTIIITVFCLPALVHHPVEYVLKPVFWVFQRASGMTGSGLMNLGHFIGVNLTISGPGLDPEFLSESEWFEAAFLVFGLGVALAGWYAAKRLYQGGTSPLPERIAARAGWLHRALAAKWYVDDAFTLVFAGGYRLVSEALHRAVDVFLIDLLAVNGPARVVLGTGYLFKFWQNGNVQRYLGAILVGAAVVLYVLLKG